MKRNRVLVIVILVCTLVLMGLLVVYVIKRSIDPRSEITLNSEISLSTDKKYYIDNTDDYILIPNEIVFPKQKNGEYVDYEVEVKYIISVNKKAYEGTCIMSSSEGISCNQDGNKTYNVQLVNAKNKNASLIITKK